MLFRSVQKIEKASEYKVELIGNMEKYYVEKNGEIELRFIGNVTNEVGIKTVTINGINYEVEKLANTTSEYKVIITVGEEAGVKEYKYTKAILENGKEVVVNYEEKIEVLKDKPRVENFKVEEEIGSQKLRKEFDIIDKEQAMQTGYIEISELNVGTIVLEKEIQEGRNIFEKIGRAHV